MRNGEFRGQMAPFAREDLQLIPAKLKAQEAWRDLALLNASVDTMLHASDLVRLHVSTLPGPQRRRCEHLRSGRPKPSSRCI